MEAQNHILRAHQNDGELGESTMKLRAIDGTTDLGEFERSIQPEQDWTHENGLTFSRTVDRASIKMGLMPKIAKGEGIVRKLFGERQQNLVLARMKDFNWVSLKRYGPVQARVRRENRKIEEFRDSAKINSLAACRTFDFLVTCRYAGVCWQHATGGRGS